MIEREIVIGTAKNSDQANMNPILNKMIQINLEQIFDSNSQNRFIIPLGTTDKQISHYSLSVGFALRDDITR